MKKSSSAVFLMEIVVIILFFTLSVTIISGLFVTAHTKDVESGLINDALSAAQSAAESFRARGYGTFDGWDEHTGADGTRTYVWHEESFTLTAALVTDKLPGGTFDKGEVTAVSNETPDGESLASVKISRYVPDFAGGGQGR